MIITAELVAQAGQMGLVTQREIGDGLVGVRELDGDRLLTVTVHSHPVAYVRREPTSCASGGGVLDRERAVLSAVRDTDCVPQVLAGSPEESLWLSVLDGAELSEQHRNMAEYAEICQAWGATLGRLHTLPVRFSGRWTAPRPEVLDTRQLARTVRTAGARSAYATVFETFQASQPLRAAAVEVAERWTARHWIHGNLTPAHVLVTDRPALRIGFVDLAEAGLGDPAWDLASAVEVIAGLSRNWHTSAVALVEYFMQGYRHAAGPARLYPAVQALRALTIAWQLAGDPSPDRDELSFWLDRARQHGARAAERVYLAA